MVYCTSTGADLASTFEPYTLPRKSHPRYVTAFNNCSKYCKSESSSRKLFPSARAGFPSCLITDSHRHSDAK